MDIIDLTRLHVNLGLYSFTVPHYVITLNTEINTTDIDSVLKVIWYKYNINGSDTVQLTSNEISATSYVMNDEHFVSQFNISTIEDYPLGQYQCVAWIGQEMYRNMSAKAVATWKSRHTSILIF